MTRGELLDRLRTGDRWDILVIGGGATGLGTAVDAAARGYRTGLLEAADFAKGTSSRSTKLVHGGVRYLAQGRLGLVREALHERAVLLRNAPHLVHDLAFVVPAYGRWDRAYYGIGLKAYDLLAGRHGFGPARIVGPAEVRARVPTVRADGLRGGVVYHDGQFDDARLAIALYRTFLDLGGVALNALPVRGLRKEGGRVTGVDAVDAETGETFALTARAVVNATGVFADEVRRLDDPAANPIIAPSQGAHLVLDRAFLPGSSALMVPHTDDGRVLFAIPWHEHALIGTTDTPVPGVSPEPRPLAEEVEFLLKHAGRYLSRTPLRADVLSLFAGLRPLLRGTHPGETAKLSREHAVITSEAGLITITGGKWTTYRRMGADAVERAIEVAQLPPRPCVTETLILHGGRIESSGSNGSVYGSEAPAVARVLAERAGWDQILHPRLTIRAGEVVWAARHEAARSVEDVLARRSRSLFLDARASQEIAPRVAALLAEALGHSAEWEAEQARAFRALASGYLLNG